MPKNFYVDDETGTIWVDTSDYWLARTNKIKSGPHPQEQYWNGDKICIIGTVQNHTTRGLTVKAEYIAQSPDDFQGLDLMWVYIFGLVTVFFILLALYIGADLLNRKHQHIENFDNFSPKKRAEKKSKKASILELRQKKVQRRTVKEKWVAFNYSQTLIGGVIGLGIVIFIGAFVVVSIATAFETPASQIVWTDICVCTSLITAIITIMVALIAAYGLKQEIGEYTLKYSGGLEEVDFKDIDEMFTKIVDDFGLPYSKDIKEVNKDSWRVTYEIPRRCGNISYTHIEALNRFTLTIKVGKGIREDNEYKEQVRATIEKVFDEYLKVKRS